MIRNILKEFELKFLTTKTPLGAAAAKNESIAVEMRDLAKKINSFQTIFSSMRLAIMDTQCPLYASQMIWSCYSHLPIPGTEHTPSYPQIHTINDLYQPENMFGFTPEEHEHIKRHFEATQKLNALAIQANNHYMALLLNS